MRNRIYRGTTDELNALNLPSGHLAQNLDNNNLRFYLGDVPGGYECESVRAYTPPIGPGPTELIAGNMTQGFFGEVTSAELLTYEALASGIGLSAGISVFNDESIWLKFVLNNKVVFIAKKPARTNIGWNELASAEVIYEGTKSISVGNYELDVTLLRGASSDPTTVDENGKDVTSSHGSEWNRLMYPIHSGIHTDTNNPTTHTDPNADAFGSWASYTDEDLNIDYTYGDGSYTWCQEVHARGTTYRVNRGFYGVTQLDRQVTSYSNQHTGWRPCLRLQG